MTSSHTISLAGKVALVSGASKGIGVAIAGILAKAGTDLVLTARNEEELEQTAESARKTGSRVWTRTAEMAEPDDVRSLGEAALAEFGHIDILVNNAGLTIPQPLLEIGIDEFHTTINVNLLAPLLLTQVIAPGMIEQGHGKIINISSRGAIRAFRGGGVYSASKAGLQLLTQTMALEFGPHNIQANCLAPTVTNTRMGAMAWSPGPRTDTKLSRIPAGHFAEPMDVAGAVLFLASSLSDFVNGVELSIDGGEGGS
jgi:NAD(P)-dependent dehydrogenase (short-subunit alcohol dehydrogenase family)